MLFTGRTRLDEFLKAQPLARQKATGGLGRVDGDDVFGFLSLRAVRRINGNSISLLVVTDSDIPLAEFLSDSSDVWRSRPGSGEYHDVAAAMLPIDRVKKR